MMPKIKQCNVQDCFYNKNNMCHAEAITIGSIEPKCDTYAHSTQHGGPSQMGHVGACHVKDCRHNKEMACTAEGIEVGYHGKEPDCESFEPL